MIREAAAADVERIAPLFDAYRRFYRKPANMAGARRFLSDRLARRESVVLVAFDSSVETACAIGFTQLYPSFSSASMAPIFILNDLFVAPEFRGRGTGSALLAAAADYGRRAGAVRLTLSTEIANTRAQAVYERNGWVRDTAFSVYNVTL